MELAERVERLEHHNRRSTQALVLVAVVVAG
jgi:hypothetical protein